jgi:hypothetical protein
MIYLYSDGVWEFIDSQEACDLIARAPDPTAACQILVLSSQTLPPYCVVIVSHYLLALMNRLMSQSNDGIKRKRLLMILHVSLFFSKPPLLDHPNPTYLSQYSLSSYRFGSVSIWWCPFLHSQVYESIAANATPHILMAHGGIESQQPKHIYYNIECTTFFTSSFHILCSTTYYCNYIYCSIF